MSTTPELAESPCQKNLRIATAKLERARWALGEALQWGEHSEACRGRLDKGIRTPDS